MINCAIPAWGYCKVSDDGSKIPCDRNGIACPQAADLKTFDKLGPLPGPEYGYRFSLGGMVSGVYVPKNHFYSVLDYDHVRNNTDGISVELDRVVPDLRDEIAYLMSRGYVEISVSGTGYHVIIDDDNIPPDFVQKINGKIAKADSRPEVFYGDKYVWMTGTVVSTITDPIPTDEYVQNIIRRQVAYRVKKQGNTTCTPRWGYHNTTDVSKPAQTDVIIAAAQCDLHDNPIYNGDITGYKSRSEAVLALCRIISYNVYDRGQLDRVLKSSPFFSVHYPQGKGWNRVKEKNTYENVVDTFGKNLPPLIYDKEDEPKREKRQKMEIPPAPSLTGIMEAIAQYYNATAVVPQPEFARAVALAITSVMLGRHYRTNTRVYSTTYIYCVACPSMGKEHVKTTIDNILIAVGATELKGASNYGSDLENHRSLREHPRQIMVRDEAGLRMGQMKGNAKAGNNHVQAVETTQLELWGECDTQHVTSSKPSRHKMSPEVIADMDWATKPVKRPAVSMVKISTPETIMSALSIQDANNGLLARHIFFVGNDEKDPTKPPRPIKNMLVPPKIIEWCQNNGSKRIGDEEDYVYSEDPDDPGNPVEILIKDDAQEIFDAYYTLVTKAQNRHSRAQEEAIVNVLGRLHEYSIRVALNIALSDGSKVITRDHAERGVQWIKHDSLNFYVKYLHKKLTFTSKNEEICEEIVDFVKKEEGKYEGGFVNKSYIIRYCCKGLTKKTYEDIFSKLVDQGILELRPATSGGSYRRL